MNEEILHERELREQWQRDHERIHQAEHEAINKAEVAVNQRLEGMNEFRVQLQTERSNYVQRMTFDTTNSSIDTRLKLLENKGSNFEGRMWVIGAVVVIINLVIAVVVWWGHK